VSPAQTGLEKITLGAEIVDQPLALARDSLFANPGAGSQLPLGKITAEHIDEIFDTNVKGSIFTVQKARAVR
jgi:NAD(P)-dependent dehydrogenase (short-subunit alcohol dehydrogenase family)